MTARRPDGDVFGNSLKSVTAHLPHGGVAVFLEALIVEAVDLRDLPALVVAADERDSLRETHL